MKTAASLSSKIIPAIASIGLLSACLTPKRVYVGQVDRPGYNTDVEGGNWGFRASFPVKFWKAALNNERCLGENLTNVSAVNERLQTYALDVFDTLNVTFVGMDMPTPEEFHSLLETTASARYYCPGSDMYERHGSKRWPFTKREVISGVVTDWPQAGYGSGIAFSEQFLEETDICEKAANLALLRLSAAKADDSLNSNDVSVYYQDFSEDSNNALNWVKAYSTALYNTCMSSITPS